MSRLRVVVGVLALLLAIFSKGLRVILLFSVRLVSISACVGLLIVIVAGVLVVVVALASTLLLGLLLPPVFVVLVELIIVGVVPLKSIRLVISPCLFSVLSKG